MEQNFLRHLYVYKLTNKVNGMAYIGATVHSVASRLARHKTAAKNTALTGSPLLYRAAREFGWDVFTVEVLKVAHTSEELMLLEKEAIREHGTMEPNGYNRSSGGLGRPDSRNLESTRLAISNALTGRPLSVEHRAKLAAAKIGKRGNATGTRGHEPWNKGIPRTDQEREKMRIAHAAMINPKCRPIELNGIIYPSIAKAALESGYSTGQIWHRLRTGRARYLNPPPGGKTSKDNLTP